MHILLATATAFEQPELVVPDGVQLTRLIHGCGLTEATFHLTRALSTPYNWVIQAGLAGTYHEAQPLGETVVVASDKFGDAGAEEVNGQFLSLFDLNLANPNTPPFLNGTLTNPFTDYFPAHLKTVRGLSVNLSSGTAATVLQRKQQGADIETMEGAAFHFVALQSTCKFIQFRSISNLVEPRNREAWQIPAALASLQQEIQQFITSLAQQ